MQDMASLLAEESMKEFNPHEVIEGTVVLVNRDEAYVDIGYKTEIPIVKKELAYPEPEAATDVVKVGDKINVYVVALGGKWINSFQNSCRPFSCMGKSRIS